MEQIDILKGISLVPNPELEKTAITAKERETGIFHWRLKDNTEKPLSELTDEELQQAVEFSEGKLNVHVKAINNSYRMLHTWTRRFMLVDEEIAHREALRKEAEGGITK